MDGLGLTYFTVCATIAVVGALATVTARNPIRGAMGLMVMILAVGGLFLALHAQFLAAIQLIVYAGAIIVLFLFVIMLLGPSAQPPRDQRGRVVRAIGGAAFGLASVAAMALVARPMWNKAVLLAPPDKDFGSIDAMGRLLFSNGIVPFELSSALLLVAIVGAVAVARGKDSRKDAAASPSDALDKKDVKAEAKS
jgi:NADH-quinone oxidoreductase subunit J